MYDGDKVSVSKCGHDTGIESGFDETYVISPTGC